MGYESKLYVVEKTNVKEKIDGKEMVWGDVIASFDLCKVYSVSDRMRKYKDTDVYIYADDGDTMILEDRYGEPLREIPMDDAINILIKAANECDYWRLIPVAQYIVSIYCGYQKIGKCDDLVVLFFGY